jgi:hypothetical protein
VPDLRQLFNGIVRFERELWDAVYARLKNDFDLPLTHFEPMLILGAAAPERTLRQFAATLSRLRSAGHRTAVQEILDTA